ncbi:MAG: efflux RND transporter periplasmic adaptor subunit [Chloroflexi bacterium]|nr:efflux RND transporter periplasmic adaptor subunit [Chloroflexota bacterium]
MQKTKRFSCKTIFITLVTVLVIIATAIYFARPTTSDAAEVPALQTAKVRVADLVVTASGAGTIVPSSQIDLGFRTAGVLTELNVAVGDAVKTSQVLARLEENIQAEADFSALFSAHGIAEAKLALVTAQETLVLAENHVMYLAGLDAWYWEQKLTSPDTTQAEKDIAQTNMDYFLGLIYIDESDMALARAELESARVALQDTQAALDIVKAGPDALSAPIVALGTQMAKLEQARLTVESTRLIAPFDGKLTALDVFDGQTVGTSPIITIATTQKLLVHFYLDETDLDKVAVGNRVTFMFDAYPDQPIDGEVVIVEPSLQVVDGTPVIVVWASLPNETGLNLMSGMTVDAEVIAGESLKTLIVPVQALRELAPGSFAVFLVDANGQLKMTPVTVGLRDFANAEILSGVKVGDLVSTGTVETK